MRDSEDVCVIRLNWELYPMMKIQMDLCSIFYHTLRYDFKTVNECDKISSLLLTKIKFMLTNILRDSPKRLTARAIQEEKLAEPSRGIKKFQQTNFARNNW